MTAKEKLWMEYIRQNPAFAGPGAVTMSAAGVRKFFEKTYDAGHFNGVTHGRNAEAAQTEQKIANSKWLAETLFGGKKG
jgi:hypothetical protein